MKSKAVQDYYPDDVAHCYGCGKLNEHGHHIKTFWEGDETVTRFTPKEYHTAIPGYVYGGLIASLIDCHGTGTAALAAYKAEGREIDTLPPFRFVTASLQVDYLKPTPLGVELEIRGKVIEIKGRKVISEITLSANGEVTERESCCGSDARGYGEEMSWNKKAVTVRLYDCSDTKHLNYATVISFVK